MAVIRSSLLTLLDNTDEPLLKRIKIADNAFKSSELLLPHKEVILLQWIIEKSDNNNNREAWGALHNWISSDQFSQLNRNDINTDEISSIIELLKNKLMLMENVEIHVMENVISSLLILIDNVNFQQYFKYNVEVYCQLICCILNNISNSNYLEEFLKKNLFFKALLAEEKFHKCFLDIILPALTRCLLKFSNNTTLFKEASRIVQKCVFYRNHANFELFIKHFFDNVKVEKHTVPKILFKHLLHFYEENADVAKLKYKLVFHAFCVAYEGDFELAYRFFILLIHILGFNLEEKLIVHKISKLEIPKTNLSLNKSQEVILELLDIFSEKNNTLDCKVSELTFTEFIRNILRQILYFNTPLNTSYKIFMKAILIDPIVIEPIIDSIIVYAMMADNKNQKEVYERFIISIFEIYAKLHRIENLVAKMVSILNDSFNKKTMALQEIYEFRGQKDVERHVVGAKDFNMEDILTKNILGYFSTCICNLASWQVINVFKTLLFYLNKNLSNIDKVENDDFMYFTYMEILSSLISTLLSSIRIAEHTVASNVVDKSVRELEELKNLLKQFGMAVLNREHNHMLMRSFLNIAYHWAEIFIVLAYYSINNEVQLDKSLDNDFTSCNITYLHPYLNVKQWCLISERITNFGELPCKKLLKKLYTQKLRAMLLFEKNVNDDFVLNVTRSLTIDLENGLKDILYDKYIVNHLLVKMDSPSVLFIAEYLINNIDISDGLHKQLHILDSPLLLTAINYVIVTKINKVLIKQKRKLNEDVVKTAVSSRICSLFTEDILYKKEDKELIKNTKEIYYSKDTDKYYKWKVNEEKINKLFGILKRFPVIYSSDIVQKICFLYLCSLHKDLMSEFKKGRYSTLQDNCEEMIIGILQHNKFKMLDVLEVDIMCKEVVSGYKEWEHIFCLITENVFKCEYSIRKYEVLVSEFTKNLANPIHLHCCFIIINTVNKMKKTKMPKDVKMIAEKYKTMICDEILRTVSEGKPEVNLVNGYAYALRNFLSQDDEKLSKLLNYLNSYVEFAVSDLENYDTYLTFFITLLQNQSKIQSLDDNFPYKIWKICKENKTIHSRFEEYAQLVVLIFEHIPNETFSTVTTDLLNITDSLFISKDYILLSKQLKTWESVISCNLNPVKMKILNSVIERLLHKLTLLLQDSVNEETLYANIFNFEKTLIQTNHFLLTPAMMDMLILSATLIITSTRNGDFRRNFNLAISLLEQLLKHRKPLVMDRLPPYLQQYRILLKCLCKKGNSNLNLEETSIREISDCAHQLEKLTKNLVTCQKDMARIAMYLIADILGQYEQTTLNPNVKIHLNNCIYSFISICDQHAVTYLMRVLSSASTEIFKIMYENYKKYYRFTGKI